MTEETTEQAVVEETEVKTETKVESGAEESSARKDDDLEKLLAEFEKPREEAKPESKGPSKPEQKTVSENDPSKEVLRRLDAWEQERKTEREAEAARQFRSDMEKTINKVRGDLPSEPFDDVFVEAWIDAEARADKRLRQAWIDRAENPKQFERVMEGLGRKFAKKFETLPDKQATEDREAVTAAVRGASTKAPESKPADFSKMSDVQFREEIEKNFGFSPGV